MTTPPGGHGPLDAGEGSVKGPHHNIEVSAKLFEGGWQRAPRLEAAATQLTAAEAHRAGQWIPNESAVQPRRFDGVMTTLASIRDVPIPPDAVNAQALLTPKDTLFARVDGLQSVRERVANDVAKRSQWLQPNLETA